MDIQYSIIHTDKETTPDFDREQIADFLYNHLDEYGDSKEAILKTLESGLLDEAQV